MNERIRELAKCNERIENFFVTGPAQRAAIEQFAQLIVKECISVPYAMWDKAELNADLAVKIEHRIKEHFGVEE